MAVKAKKYIGSMTPCPTFQYISRVASMECSRLGLWMHHFDAINALEMLPVKGIDGPDFSRLGEGDDPCIYEIDCLIAINRDGIRDDSLVTDLDAVRMQDCVKERYNLTAFEFIKALKDPDQFSDHDRGNQQPDLSLCRLEQKSLYIVCLGWIVPGQKANE